jgi:purine-binding chemotaxis protein CheW
MADTATGKGRKNPRLAIEKKGKIQIMKKRRYAEMGETAAMEQAMKAMANREGKYLTFTLAEEEYGIGILKVKEIIGIMAITTVPRTPEYMKGVINLRGKVIPVVDLRLKFGMEAMDYTERTCIIVVEITGDGKKILLGILVDSVSEVLNIKGSDIEDTPNFGSQLDTEYILGMAKTGGRVKILLDIDRVLNDSEVASLSASA